MLNIKHGQAEISEYIKSDISELTIKEALNSGKRLRALCALGCGSSVQIATSVEYIHNGILLLSDIEINREQRRGSRTMHIKYGYSLASKLSAHLIARGIAGATSEVAALVSKRVSSMCLDLTPDLDHPLRVVNNHLKNWHGAGGMFAIAFIMAAGPSAAAIGECLGVCYYLCMRSNLNIDHNDRIDLFTENMREAVTLLTKKGLWSPLLKEIVNFIMGRFKAS